MEKYYQEDGILKNIYLTDTHVMATDEDYGNIEAFLSKVNMEKKGKLDTVHKYEYNQIKRINIIRENNVLQIYFNENGKTDVSPLIFRQKSDFEEFSNFILSKCNSLQKTVEKVKTKSSLLKPSMFLLADIFLSLSLVLAAIDLEAGKTITASGSKKGLKMLFISIADTLGVWGSIALASVVTIGCLYYMYKAYQNSAFEREVYHL